MTLSRRDLLAMSSMALAGTTLSASAARAQGPKRGGTLTLRGWDPPLFDQMLQTAYRVQIPITFTHSRLVKHKAGPGVAPATLAIEGDLAESWSQPNETTCLFKLRRGVRWHPKPPVNGRELTAEDVRYTVERFLTVKGNPMAYMLSSVDRVEAVDRYTVKFVMKEPFSWLLDVLANPMAVAIVARECVEKFGDLKKAEAVIGTGPWMLNSYRPNVGLTFVRHPNYFVAGLPYIDRIEYLVDEDNASRMAAFLAGKYDLGWEFPGSINRTDWIQIKDTLKQKRPNLRTAEFPSNVETHISMRTDQPPFKDVRVRQAVSLGIDRQGIIDASFEGVGIFNAAVPAGLVEWALPMNQMANGAKYFRYDPAEAKRLLAAAGYPNGFAASLCFTTYGSTLLSDNAQLVLKDLKNIGINTKLDQREYGAYVSTCRVGKYESMGFGPAAPYLEPDNFLSSPYAVGEPRNRSHVNDPALNDMLSRQRRTIDVGKRRELIYEIQRYLARQQYYVHMPAAIYIGVWDRALKNYGPNLGFDYGGRLVAAWLDR